MGDCNEADGGADTASSEYIELIVRGCESESIKFKVKMNASLLKLKKAYSARIGESLNGYRFLFDGRRIEDNDTPQKLGLKDHDTIDVYQLQIGGNKPRVQY